MYYDQEKEEIKERVGRIRKEIEIESTLSHAGHVRESIRQKWGLERKKEELRKSNMRIILIAGVLTLIIYVFLTY